MIRSKRAASACIAAAVLVCAAGARAQEPCDASEALIPDVRFNNEAPAAERVSLNAMEWFEGVWEGRVFGMNVQHVVLNEAGGQMPGLVRLFDENGLALYELSSFLVVDGQLAYRNRLFDKGLAVQLGPSGDVMTRRALSVDDAAVYFDGITFASLGDDCAVVSFVLPDDQGSLEKHAVFYSRLSIDRP
ncbi:MAG: DUF6265 family protein [Pseudomonadota bacterium]